MLLWYVFIENIKPCPSNGRMIADYGQITSPNYPNDYPPDQDCVWIIEVPQGSKISLKFQAFETHNSIDSLEVRDGGSSSSTRIGDFYGSTIPQDILSSGNQLRLYFETSALYEKSGFAATFSKGTTRTIALYYVYKYE